MFKSIAAVSALAIVFSMFSVQAIAGLASWTSEKNEDPFTKGIAVTVNYMSSMRSGIFIFCRDSGSNFSIRLVPGFEYELDMKFLSPTLKVAIDNKILFESTVSNIGSVGPNMVAVDYELDRAQAELLAGAFVTARKQIAFNDGISDQPHLLKARGSTAVGKQLMTCLLAD